METVMEKVTRAWIFLTLGGLATTSFACGGLQSHPAARIVPISGFEKVAGKWEGLSKRVPDMRDDAWVLLNIGNNGTFTFVSNRRTGMLLGTGTFTPIEGKLFGKTSTGTGTLTLHDKAGNPILVVEVALNDGNHYYLEMTQLRQ